MSENDLCYLSATEALKMFKAKTLSPVELLEAQIARADHIELKINAFAIRRTEQARAAARAAEAVYATNPADARPLEGLTLALKDEHTLIGDNTRQGSALLRGQIDTKNAPITQRLLDAGAVIHARSTVPEFCCAGFTRTKECGVTRNPWNLALTCGGSSGGSGTSLAAGTTTLASGSDIGGSIRIPAAWNGVVGLKPSWGRVPEGDFAYVMNTYNHAGPMARSVADCALMFNVINGGPCRTDPMCDAGHLEVPLTYGDLKGKRIALSMDLGFFDVCPDVVANTLAAADALRARGAIVEPVHLPWDKRVAEAAACGLGFLMGRMLAGTIKGHEDLVNDYTLQFAAAGMRYTAEDFLAHYEVMGWMHETLQQVFDHYDAMICPTLAVNDTPAEGPSDPLHGLLETVMTYPFNMLSRHPVLNVPTGFTSTGAPSGMQIVGRLLDDVSTFHIGANLEIARPWAAFRPVL